MRKVYIFGNGLGMAIAPEAYDLTSVMTKVWAEDFVDPEQKKLIVACLPPDVDRPTSEEQLATLQQIVAACEILLTVKGFETGHWLSPDGQRFPDAVYRFAFQVARGMHYATHFYGPRKGERCELPDDFASPLIEALGSGNNHVATLNYDSLLSSTLKKTKFLPEVGQFDDILGSEVGLLFDGFDGSKFDRRNMFRPRGQGAFYMHLHGCPLFADRAKSKPHRLTEATLRLNHQSLRNVGRHIVLTHFRHKPTIISSSEILKTYWEFLQIAIEESSEILLFGYSGNDLHLNRLIAQTRDDKNVRVVEWLGSGTKDQRGKFWREQLGGDVDLKLMEDVLGFTDW